MTLSRRRFLAASGSAALVLSRPAWAQQQQVNREALAAQGRLPDHYLGPANAPVTIVEYASMTCPHCAAFHVQTFPQLKAQHIDPGKVRFVLRDFPLDVGAVAAFMLARCAAGDETRLGSTEPPPPAATTRYYAVIDALFAKQDVWAPAPNLEASLFEIAKQAGFTQETFRSCLTNQKLYEAVVAAQENAAKAFEVASTPTFFVNGKRARGALTIAELTKLIEAEAKS